MDILKGVPLKLHSTMRLGGTADYLAVIKTRQDLETAELWAEKNNLPVRMIGNGSNIIWRDEGFHGLLMVNKIRGLKKISEDERTATYRIGAGENWDNIVDQLVGLKLQGVECLSAIPGTVGATPVQNVGAYGQEISQTLVEVEAYDRMEKAFVMIPGEACAFGYRTSRFKTIDNGRFMICSITLRLNKAAPAPPFYESLQQYLDKKGQTRPTLLQIRRAVIAIRSQKLPDPLKVPNNGSFFANPVVDKDHYQRIKARHKNIKAWPVDKKTYKLSAAWLIETAGFKAKKDAETGMATWKNQALVLVNENAKHTADLLRFQDKITTVVSEMFQVNLEREPELLP